MILPIITVGVEMLIVMTELIVRYTGGALDLGITYLMIFVFIASCIICGISIGYNSRRIKKNFDHKGKWITGLVFSIVGTAYAAIFLITFFITFMTSFGAM